ncbi:hypothetical protein MASR1M60_24090 [Rhodocyclaceae bacterium]
MGLLDWLKPTPPLDPENARRVEKTVDIAEPLIRQTSDYAHALAPAVQFALDHCARIAEQIPGPVEITRAAFAANPLVHAIFGSADDIATMLARSECVREHMTEMALAGGQCCAILGMRHREKAGFGVGISGDVVRTDVPQRTLYFTDHTLAEPSPDLTGARRRLRDALYDGLLKGFAAHVADEREIRDGLSREHAIMSAQQRASRLPADHTRRLETLSERLHASRDALQPERLREALIDTLSHPEPYLSLTPVSVTVDRFGIIAGPDSGQGGDTLHFMELSARDKRRWVVMLARINQDEVREALERLESSRRYIVI